MSQINQPTQSDREATAIYAAHAPALYLLIDDIRHRLARLCVALGTDSFEIDASLCSRDEAVRKLTTHKKRNLWELEDLVSFRLKIRGGETFARVLAKRLNAEFPSTLREDVGGTHALRCSWVDTPALTLPLPKQFRFVIELEREQALELAV